MRNLLELPACPEDGVVHVVIESPAGATNKIKWDPALEVFTLSRPLPLGVSYPHDWGFVPSTRGEDGDPIDALVLSEGATFPGVVLPSRPLGVVWLEQNRKGAPGRERNDRLVAVPRTAPRREARAYTDLPERVREEIEQFFLTVTAFERRDVRILGWGGPEDAWALVKRASIARR